MKNASGEFRREFLRFSKILFMVWSRDSRLTTNVEGREVEGMTYNEIHRVLSK